MRGRFGVLKLRIIRGPEQPIHNSPAAVLFPGIPIKPFNVFPELKNVKIPYGVFGASFGGILNIEPIDGQLIFINDGNTHNASDQGPTKYFPQVPPICLLGLYAKLVPSGAQFRHNEGKILDSNHVPCITDLTRVEDMKRLMHEVKMNEDHICYYDATQGNFYHLNKEFQPTEKIDFGPRVLSLHNFMSNPELRAKFEEEYSQVIENYAQIIKENHAGEIPKEVISNARRHDQNPNPSEIIFRAVKNLINEKPPQNVVSDCEAKKIADSVTANKMSSQER